MFRNMARFKVTKMGIILVIAFFITIWAFLSFTQTLIKASFIIFDLLVIVLVSNYNSMQLINKRLKLISMSLIIIVLVSVTILSLFIISDFKGSFQEEEKYDFIIIMGDAVQGTKIPKRLSNRLDKGIEIYLKKKAMIIVSGGKGPGEDIAEADAMKQYLVDRGIPTSDIIVENQSDSTKQNLVNIERLLANYTTEFPMPALIIVSSNYHLFRINFLAEYYGLRFDTIPSDTPSNVFIRAFVREWFAIANDLRYVLTN